MNYKCFAFRTARFDDWWCGLSALPSGRINQPRWRVTANVACFARLPFGSFAKMCADLAMATALYLHIAANLVIALPSALLFFRIGDLVDKVCQQAYIFLLPQQNAIGRVAIAACTSGFLIILLHRF